MKRLIAALPLLLAGLAHADTIEWTFDPTHTNIGFSVPHLKVSSVVGNFREASAVVKLDDADMSKSTVTVDINAASIDTDNDKRDAHLKAPDFLDTAKFPKIRFQSTKIAKAGAGYKLTGDLTIRDVKKSVTLDATLSAPIKTPFGNHVRAATVTGKINRGDFGLKWNKGLEAGGVLVGEEVTINVTTEVTK